MERNLLLRIAYDGTDFHGWQDQPGLRTVQGVLKERLQRILRHPVSLIGCGRTDAGVHAASHIDSVRTTSPLHPEKIRTAMESRLPTDLAVLEARDVHPDFHATRSATCKLYRYRIHNAKHRPVSRFTHRHAFHYWHHLNVDRMNRAADLMVGRHDFTSFTPTHVVRNSMERTVLRCTIERHLDEVRIDVEGDGFLYNQVRNMVGTLIEVGRGRWEPERVAEIISARSRPMAGQTAPPQGLCLEWVRYPPELLQPATGPADDRAPCSHRPVDPPVKEKKLR